MSPMPASSLSAMAWTRRTVALSTGSRPSCSTASASRCSAERGESGIAAVTSRTIRVYTSVSANLWGVLRNNFRRVRPRTVRRVDRARLSRVPDLGSMRPIQGLLTAMVTPMKADGAVNEEAAVALGAHLLANGSDGLVLCGTTGESPTLSDDEMVALVATMVEELGDEGMIAAGAGSNDTHHATHLIERMAAAGAVALLSVTGYYNRPNRRGIVRHYEEVGRAAGGTPVIVYNIPSRTTVNIAPDLL